MVFVKQESDDGFWNPETPGEELIGVVYRKFIGDFGVQFEIETKDKKTFTTPSHKILQNKMSKVEIGDLVKLVYIKTDLPKLKGKNGAKVYDVYIDKIII